MSTTNAVVLFSRLLAATFIKTQNLYNSQFSYIFYDVERNVRILQACVNHCILDI